MQQYHSRIIDQAENKHLNVGFVTDSGCMMSLGVTALKEKCINANINLSKELSNKQIQTLVITQKWGGYDESLLIDGLLAYGNLIDNFKRYDSSRKVFILLDNPWDESSINTFDPMKRIENRFDVEEKILNTNFLVSVTKEANWNKGNLFVKSYLSKKATLIETNVCRNDKCNLMMSYKDDDHLRSTYVKKYASWIDKVFE